MRSRSVSRERECVRRVAEVRVLSEQVRQQIAEKQRQLRRLQQLQGKSPELGGAGIRPSGRLALWLCVLVGTAGGVGGPSILLLAVGLSCGVLLVRRICVVPHDPDSGLPRRELRLLQLQREITELERRLQRESELG